MGEEAFDRAGEALGVGQGGMRVEGGFVDPRGVDEVDQGRAGGLVEMDAQAAGFGAGRREDAREFVTHL